MFRGLFAALLLCLCAPVAAQDAPVRVVMESEQGNIVIEVDPARAPITSANFLNYVDRQLYDGASFYRAMPGGPNRGLIQAGVEHSRRLPPIPHEPTSRTGLSHTDGAVSIARDAPGTATADITIMLGDMSYLDAGGADPDGYAVFGRVVEGMDIVRRIHAAPTSRTEGQGWMRVRCCRRAFGSSPHGARTKRARSRR
jgi:peptidyl-prolyl cis-trans isomerase A (cyclophilin A)